MTDSYYNPKDLRKFKDIKEFEPKLAEKFFDWYGEVFKAGALSEKEKALIALGVAHAIQCPYCIDAYTEESMKKGATETMMMEAVHVSGAITGGATMIHGLQMMNKAKKISM